MQLTDADARLVLWLTEQSHDGVTGSIVDRLAYLRSRLYESLSSSEPEEHLPEVPEADEIPEDPIEEPIEDPIHEPAPEPQAEEIPEEAPAESDPTNGTGSLPWVVPPEVPAEPVAAEA